jgi:hypothetical protein
LTNANSKDASIVERSTGFFGRLTGRG